LRSYVVLAGLGAYIYFVTWKRRKGRHRKEDRQGLRRCASRQDRGDPHQLREREATTVKKDNATWQVVTPVTAKADETEVSGITSALATTDIVRVIDENPTSLNDYGLSNPRIEVDFKVAGDKDYRKLLIGEKSPTGSDLFAKRNDEKRVFLIPAFQEIDVQQGHVRAARQGRAEVRPRQGRRRRSRRRRQDTRDGEGRRGLEDQEAARDAS
jgi:hypothetical protein